MEQEEKYVRDAAYKHAFEVLGEEQFNDFKDNEDISKKVIVEGIVEDFIEGFNFAKDYFAIGELENMDEKIEITYKKD